MAGNGFGFSGLGFGVPELILVGLVAIPLIGVLLFWTVLKRRARRFGYGSIAAYLRAAPRSDPEKRDAVDLALKGLVFCVLGMVFPPFTLIGLIPLFYGGRKVVYASMGLGLIDDPEPPRA